MADGMKKCKGNGSTTLLFSLKGLEILGQERRGRLKTIVMEHFNSIFFHKSGSANKQYTNQSFTETITKVIGELQMKWYSINDNSLYIWVK